MRPRVNYSPDTDCLSVSWVHKECDGVTCWTSSHNTGWEMSPEKWLELLSHVSREIDRVQLAEAERQCGELAGDLASRLAEHQHAT